MVARIGVLVLAFGLWVVLVRVFNRMTGKADARKDPVTPAQRRYLAFAAPLFLQNGDALHVFKSLMGTKAQVSKVLRDWWYIKDRAGAIEALESLTAGERHTSVADSVFTNIIKKGHTAPLSLETLRAIDGYAEADAGSLEEINHAIQCFNWLKSQLVRKIELTESELLEIGSLAAWDYGRVGFIARYSAYAGYIDEDTAWNYMRVAGDRAASAYSSWRQYYIAYYIGRTIAFVRTRTETEEQVGFLADLLNGNDIGIRELHGFPFKHQPLIPRTG